MKRIVLAAAAAVVLLACGKHAESTNASVSAPAQSAGSTTSVSPAKPVMAAEKLQGTIVETMDAGGYTYMKLQTADGERWVATPAVTVQKGQLVTVLAQMTAEKFQSTTLGRTFDRIVFGTLESPTQVAATGPDQSSAAERMQSESPAGDSFVEKAEGAKSHTVSEVWSTRAALAGKEVVVRGRVVKYLSGIMGTNFMHLRDGSGSDASGDSDLTITTNEQASLGEVVTIRGVVLVDKDFGAGYRYPVIIEKATLMR
jgi:hypothetical protein